MTLDLSGGHMHPRAQFKLRVYETPWPMQAGSLALGVGQPLVTRTPVRKAAKTRTRKHINTTPYWPQNQHMRLLLGSRSVWAGCSSIVFFCVCGVSWRDQSLHDRRCRGDNRQLQTPAPTSPPVAIANVGRWQAYHGHDFPVLSTDFHRERPGCQKTWIPMD